MAPHTPPPRYGGMADTHPPRVEGPKTKTEGGGEGDEDRPSSRVGPYCKLIVNDKHTHDKLTINYYVDGRTKSHLFMWSCFAFSCQVCLNPLLFSTVVVLPPVTVFRFASIPL